MIARSTQGPGVYIQRISYDDDGNAEYIGWASPGASESREVWQIQKYTYSSMYFTAAGFAGGSSGFDKAWASRAGYDYS